ncbi:MAG: MBL fold metallo-hydrolase [Candidatus Nanoarchaeia archaeon]
MLKQFRIGGMQNFCYIIGENEVAVVDPGFDADIILDEIADRKVKFVILTHTHFDHTGSLNELMFKLSEKGQEPEIVIHDCKKDSYEDYTVKPVKNNDIIEVDDIKITVLHTPGHTPGSICLLFDDNLITGDTIFVEGCGRTDLPGGNTEEMFESIQRIKELPDDIKIWPGHDYGSIPQSTVKHEKDKNPYFRHDDFELFAEERGGNY